MSSRGSGSERPAEERAEELMQRVAGDVSRFLKRAWGRAREEMEDVVAEARSINEQGEDSGSGTDSVRRSSGKSAG
jgi:hypothetical protein